MFKVKTEKDFSNFVGVAQIGQLGLYNLENEVAQLSRKLNDSPLGRMHT